MFVLPGLFDDLSLVKEGGRVGSPGTVRKDWFDSEEEAVIARQKLCDAKQKKGYRLSGISAVEIAGCRIGWLSGERHLNTRLQFVHLAFLAFITQEILNRFLDFDISNDFTSNLIGTEK